MKNWSNLKQTLFVEVCTLINSDLIVGVHTYIDKGDKIHKVIHNKMSISPGNKSTSF